MITQNQRTNQRAAARVSLLQQYWRGIQDKHCRGIQDTLNIKEKFCPRFHDFSQFSCPGFLKNSKIACLCTVMYALNVIYLYLLLFALITVEL